MLTIVAGTAGCLLIMHFDGTPGKKQNESLRDLIDNSNMESMGHFLSTRPFTNADFSNSILRAATRSIFIAWGLWFAGFVVCLLIAVLIQQWPKAILPPEFGAWYLPLTLLGPWIAMTNAATIALTGRAAKLVFMGTAALVSYGILLFFIKEFVSSVAHEMFLQICAFGGSVAVILFTLYAYFKAHRSGFLSRKSQCAAGCISGSIAIMAIAFRPHELPMTGYVMILAFSSLVVLPIATTPLAIAWNRHR